MKQLDNGDLEFNGKVWTLVQGHNDRWRYWRYELSRTCVPMIGPVWRLSTKVLLTVEASSPNECSEAFQQCVKDLANEIL